MKTNRTVRVKERRAREDGSTMTVPPVGARARKRRAKAKAAKQARRANR